MIERAPPLLRAHTLTLTRTTGSAANYIIPAVLNLSLLRRVGAKRGLLSEVTLNKTIVLFGLVFLVMGTTVTLREAGSHGHAA